ncbi:unnamed protein product [Trichobilharzia szidati]|nr:unnamed protein product [Trichobilharzia szidati]
MIIRKNEELPNSTKYLQESSNSPTVWSEAYQHSNDHILFGHSLSWHRDTPPWSRNTTSHSTNTLIAKVWIPERLDCIKAN